MLALLRLLRAAGGTMHRDELQMWLQPDAKEYKGGLLEGTIGVATSLGYVHTIGSQVGIVYGGSLESPSILADAVHARLRECGEDDVDRVVFQTFAWFAVECDRRSGTAWISEMTVNDLVGEIDKVLRIGDTREDRYFNSTKYAPWRNWIEFTGLATPLARITDFHPYIAERLNREVHEVGRELGFERDIDIDEVLLSLARRMPYLDGGRVFNALCRKSAWNPPETQISYLLSDGLRELNEMGAIEISSLGDARGIRTLTPDETSPIRTVKMIKINRGVLG